MPVQVWITEFAINQWACNCTPTRADQDRYMSAVLPALEACDTVFRYRMFSSSLVLQVLHVSTTHVYLFLKPPIRFRPLISTKICSVFISESAEATQGDCS